MSSSANEPAQRVVALLGNPNTGKSTLFNLLTGLKQKTANYPGVTVERLTGQLDLGGESTTLVDVPGAYSLAAQSPDEMVAVDVLLGNYADLAEPSALLIVADATNLRRNLFLVSQAIELGKPVVLALNMSDLAGKQGIAIDAEQLASYLGITVVPVSASRAEGIPELKTALEKALKEVTPAAEPVLPEVRKAAEELQRSFDGEQAGPQRYELERALIDRNGWAESRVRERLGADAHASLLEKRSALEDDKPLLAEEAEKRYARIDAFIERTEQRNNQQADPLEWLNRLTDHPVWGTLIFVLVMATVFQSVFSWAGPLMDLIDGATGAASEAVAALLPDGAIASLITDGIIAGVGSVVIFLPQIMILYLFIIVLEDSGYMARAAFLMDRLMRSCGLSGQSFIPMLSGFACAVPSIMATRVIPDRRDRLATILAVPFMTCSARLPVYALLIAAFVPERYYLGGFINLQGLVLLGLYLLGIVGGVLTALLMKRTALRGPTPSFLIELPPYRIPNLRSVLIRLLDRVKIFIRRAGTVIFSVAVVIWALAYFPRPLELGNQYETLRTEAAALYAGDELDQAVADIDNAEAAAYLEQSALGRIGKTIQPLFAPLGWDWKVSAAVVASFPAREVVIAVLGTTYSMGAEVAEDDPGLIETLRNEKWSDGSPIFTLPMAIGLLIFYAFCLQCGATVAVIKRETNSWGWASFAWVYMTGMGYLGALLAYQLF